HGHDVTQPSPSFPTRRSSDLAHVVARAQLEPGEKADRGADGASPHQTSRDEQAGGRGRLALGECSCVAQGAPPVGASTAPPAVLDRKSTRLNSSHLVISYAVF